MCTRASDLEKPPGSIQVGRNREKKGLQQEGLLSADHLCLMLTHVRFGNGWHVSGKGENHCSVWPLSWVKAKRMHLFRQYPSTGFSQVPWWHQPRFRNYLTSVFQISSEPARVTNTHISSGNLSTYWTGCRPSGMNCSFMSQFVLYLGKEHMKPSVIRPKEATGKAPCPAEKSDADMAEIAAFSHFCGLFRTTPLQLCLPLSLCTQAQKK